MSKPPLNDPLVYRAVLGCCQVLPAHAHRHAVTLWYYDEDERSVAMARAAGPPGATGTPGGIGGSGGSGEVEKAHLRSRHEARAFLLWILGSDKEATQVNNRSAFSSSKVAIQHNPQPATAEPKMDHSVSLEITWESQSETTKKKLAILYYTKGMQP